MAAHVRKIARAAALALFTEQGEGASEYQFAARYYAIEIGRTGTTETGDVYFYVNLPEDAPIPGVSLGAPSALAGADYAAVYEVMLADAELGPLHPIKVADKTPETITVGDEYFPAAFAGVPLE